MSGPTRVVWVCPELHHEPRSGAGLRTTRLLQALATRVPVTLVVVGPADARLAGATGVDQVRSFDRLGSRVAKAGTALVRGWPTDTAAAWSADARAFVDDEVERGGTVVVDHLQMAPFLPPGRHVLSLHNAEAALLAQQPRPTTWPGRAARRWDVPRTQRLERQALTRAGLVVTVSERDATTLGVPAVVVPNGADLPAAVPPLPSSGPLLFVGALKYAPNREAVRWWAKQVWEPGLAGLRVVGSGSEFLPADLAGHPGVEVRGEVLETGPELAAARAVVVPLQHGGGTRLKVLEAMAWGRPVVSTSKGVEGLPVVDGEHALVEDDPVAFALAVRRLQSDDVLAAELAERGRRLAQSYSWPSLTPAFVQAVLRVAT